ncbi:MAG TPA: IPTL-CTERM sorting domain-containing protein [Thermoanaerobaculia bacterium]|nr:IPTL-CTERM sorting domain-containing protein [Thermoanaerobaculia bacterium]
MTRTLALLRARALLAVPAFAAVNGARGGTLGGPAPGPEPEALTQGFDDITTLPGAGWFFQNNSAPLGLTDWFQGNDTVFPAHAGAPTAYIGANFNNTGGVGTISNWMLTPEMPLFDGDSISFWTRTSAGSIWPDRLELRLSTNGASANVGTLATDVGDFTTLLLSVNPTLVQGGYPEVWTQYTATLAGIPAAATGRYAFRYFVTNGGPSGSASNYIGIDTLEIVDAPCALTCPDDVTATATGSTAVVNFPAPVASGPCGTVICTPASGSSFPVGTTTVTCEADTEDSCTFDVIVEGSAVSILEIPTLDAVGLALLALLLAAGAFLLMRRRVKA